MTLPSTHYAEDIAPDANVADALIGYTGFVGSNLLRQRPFSALYNSRNIEEIRGRRFDTLVCAGARAEKWWANQHPAEDRAGIQRLCESLARVDARRVVLVSTVDVYPDPRDVNEDTSIDINQCHAYGRHRLELEQIVAERFDAVVVRLPGLFGSGLKKNVLYDFRHDNNVDRVDSRGVFQFYDIGRLTADVARAIAANISLLNVATEPISVADIARDCFGMAFTNHVAASAARYDVRSIHDAEFGGSDGYLLKREEVMDALKIWVVKERERIA